MQNIFPNLCWLIFLGYTLVLIYITFFRIIKASSVIKKSVALFLISALVLLLYNLFLFHYIVRYAQHTWEILEPAQYYLYSNNITDETLPLYLDDPYLVALAHPFMTRYIHIHVCNYFLDYLTWINFGCVALTMFWSHFLTREK